MSTGEREHAAKGSTDLQVACISDADLKVAMSGSLPQPLQIALWNWLHDSAANPVDLLTCLKDGRLGAHRFSGLREQEPYVTLLKSLPGIDNAAEPNVRRVLVQRLGTVIRMLAKDRQLRESMTIPVWSDLFDFSRRICDSQFLSEPVFELLAAFDAEHRLPFPHTHGCAHSFARLVADLQPDNRLKDRWLAILCHENDPILAADLFEAWRGLLSQPVEIDHSDMNTALSGFCEQVEHIVPSDVDRIACLKELDEMVRGRFRCHWASFRQQLANTVTRASLSGSTWLLSFASFMKPAMTDTAVIAQLTQVAGCKQMAITAYANAVATPQVRLCKEYKVFARSVNAEQFGDRRARFLRRIGALEPNRKRIVDGGDLVAQYFRQTMSQIQIDTTAFETTSVETVNR